MISVVQKDAVPGHFGNKVAEGDDATFVFTRSGDTTNPFTIEFSINSTAFGSAEPGSDF
jgi:hypothetical protein